MGVAVAATGWVSWHREAEGTRNQPLLAPAGGDLSDPSVTMT